MRMRCSYYCDGYCFYEGDNGYPCDKIDGAGEKIQDGWCPKEEDERELAEHVKAIMEAEKQKG